MVQTPAASSLLGIQVSIPSPVPQKWPAETTGSHNSFAELNQQAQIILQMSENEIGIGTTIHKSLGPCVKPNQRNKRGNVNPEPSNIKDMLRIKNRARFGSTYTKVGTI